MKNGLRLAVFAALLLAGAPAFAAVKAPPKWVLPDGKAHCWISISLKKKLGDTESVLFRTALDTEKQCRALAAMHEPNFNPDVDASKRVAYKWTGPRGSSKMVARGERRRPGKRR